MTGLTGTRKEIRKEVEAAWRSFVVDGRLPDRVRPEIRRSWRRVRARVDPTLRTCPSALAERDVAARAEAEEAFRVASRVVSHFAGRLAPEGHVVAFLDAEGVLLTLHGNRRTRARLADVNFAPGACWAENIAGTNGPGTALVESRPVEVFASEHFVEAWQPWTCASVPVRFGGRVLGAVDITSPWTAGNASLLFTAEALARAIESELEADALRAHNAALARIAEGALRARDDFLLVASHELKTPLTPLQLNIQKLQRVVESAGERMDPAHLAQALRGADGHVRRLAKFIDDLLDASRVAHQPLRLDLEPADLGETARSVVEQRRGDLDRTGCHVTVSAPCKVIGQFDRAWVARALEHLLVNAMKHAPGRIEVEVERDHANARLLVRDNGPGIPPEARERIFRAFERGVSCRNVAGFGLGLHVVRRIAEAHGGTARAESALGKGSTFVVELPLSTVAHSQDASAEP
jgi:sigma-54 dependent transcriptional regulator, acetoin dehydrogenase operon transcriptional activator AcoR